MFGTTESVASIFFLKLSLESSVLRFYSQLLNLNLKFEKKSSLVEILCWTLWTILRVLRGTDWVRFRIIWSSHFLILLCKGRKRKSSLKNLQSFFAKRCACSPPSLYLHDANKNNRKSGLAKWTFSCKILDNKFGKICSWFLVVPGQDDCSQFYSYKLSKLRPIKRFASNSSSINFKACLMH